MTNSKQTIFLIPARKSSASSFFKKNNRNDIDYWIYLGRHVTRFVEIETIINQTIKKIEIGEELQNTAKIYRQNYIDFIGNIAKSEEMPFWYLTSLSEKNPFVSEVFLNFCYIHTIVDLLKDHRGVICIFCESNALIKSLKKNLERNPDLDVKCQELRSSITCDQINTLFTFTRNKVWFVIRFLSRIFYAKLVNRLTGKEHDIPDKPSITIIYSWADQRSFSESNQYHDVYLGNLGIKIEQNHLIAHYLINILPTIWYPFAVKKIVSTRVRWLLFEEFLDFSDITSALFKVYRQKNWISRDFLLAGLEISDLIHEEKARDYESSRVEESYLYYCAGKKMSRLFKINSFIYPFENHIWEKMIIEGMRSVSQDTSFIGYAHSTVTPLELSYSISSIEKNFAPLPNIILVNGVRAKRVLTESGFDEIPIEVTGALRYEGSERFGQEISSENKNRILVVLSGDMDRSIEMILKCFAAFGNSDGIIVTFKPHPILKITNFTRYTVNLPRNFSISSEHIQKLFKKSDLVIYNDSAAAVEAAALGIPVLHIKSDFTIDLNIFENTGIVLSANSPEQLRSFAIKLFNNRGLSSAVINTVIGELFAPVDEQKIMSIVINEKDS